MLGKQRETKVYEYDLDDCGIEMHFTEQSNPILSRNNENKKIICPRYVSFSIIN